MKFGCEYDCLTYKRKPHSKNVVLNISTLFLIHMVNLQVSLPEIFSKLSDKQIAELGSSEDDLCRLIFDSSSYSFKPSECAYYSKSSNADYIPGSYTSLKPMLLSYKPHSKPKKSKKSATTRSGGNNKADPSFIGRDLSEGFTQNHKQSSNEEIYSLYDLFLALDNIKDGIEDEKCLVSLRRNLLQLMLIPLNHGNALQFNIVRWEKYTIVDYDWTDASSLSDKLANLSLSTSSSSTFSHLDELKYTGFKFEQIVTGYDADSTSSFHTCTKHLVNKIPVYITAEIDATKPSSNADVKSNEPSDSDSFGLNTYVELKTHNLPKKNSSELDYQLTKKLLSSWCQTKLIDCKYLTIGFRKRSESSYKLASIKSYNTNEIPGLLHSSGYPIHIDKTKKGTLITCQKLLKWYQFLIAWISNSISSDTGLVYRLEYTPSDQQIRIRSLDSTASKSIQNRVIPKWFREKYPA